MVATWQDAVRRANNFCFASLQKLNQRLKANYLEIIKMEMLLRLTVRWIRNWRIILEARIKVSLQYI